MRNILSLLAAGFVAMAVLAAGLEMRRQQDRQRERLPTTVAEAEGIAREMGLSVSLCHTVSVAGMTDEEDSLLSTASSADAWRGKVRLCSNQVTAVEGPCVATWGDVVVVGDPDLIKRLTRQ